MANGNGEGGGAAGGGGPDPEDPWRRLLRLLREAWDRVKKYSPRSSPQPHMGSTPSSLARSSKTLMRGTGWKPPRLP